MNKKKIDCRSKEGITIGLIDSIITSARVLRTHFKQYHKEYEERYRKDITPNYDIPEAVYEALKDLHQDEDVLHILQIGPYNGNILSKEDRRLMDSIHTATQLLKEKQTEIKL